MRDLWPYLRMLLAYPGRLACALAASLVGAASLGVGLGGMAVVLKQVLSKDGQNLPQLAAAVNKSLDGSSIAKWAGLHIPDGWIAKLPADRYDAVVWTVIVLSVATAIGSVANYLHGYQALTVAGWTLRDLRTKVFAHAVRLPLRTVEGRGPSNVISQVVFDTQQIWGGYVLLLQRTLSQILKGGAALVMAFVFNWQISTGGVIVMVFVGFVLRRLGKRIRKAATKGLVAQGELQRTSNEALGHLRVVKTNSAEERECDRFGATAEAQLHQELKVRRSKSLAAPLSEMAAMLALGAVAIISASWIIKGGVGADDFIMALVSLGVAAGCMKPMTSLYTDLQVTAAAGHRLNELMALRLEGSADEGKPALAPHGASIELRDVTFTYPGATAPSLVNVSLKMRHGETVAVVGPNGSGKTTLLSLLPRLLEPEKGAVLIDGTDVSAVRLDSLRRQIGVVTQETALFKGSIFWNIAYGAEGVVSEERVREAARKARAEQFIMAKPGGYGFEVGEGGGGLSGGQRQRLCIARAVLRNPSILILDEATSMVDADSERQIADALAEFSRGRTCLIVAHRLSTVVHADRIVVMNHGRIEDVGSHAELMARSATYRLIAEHQLMKPDTGVNGAANGSLQIPERVTGTAGAGETVPGLPPEARGEGG
jgi:ABC-type multidrug transport system fused ATPase/permease subunit